MYNTVGGSKQPSTRENVGGLRKRRDSTCSAISSMSFDFPEEDKDASYLNVISQMENQTITIPSMQTFATTLAPHNNEMRKSNVSEY